MTHPHLHQQNKCLKKNHLKKLMINKSNVHAEQVEMELQTTARCTDVAYASNSSMKIASDTSTMIKYTNSDVSTAN